jgi:hypothetical protein
MQELIALKNELLRIKQHYKPLEAICDLTLNKYDPAKGKYATLNELMNYIHA